MATFEIQAPDGKKYRVEGENAEGALSALQKMLGPRPGPTKDAANQQIHNELGYLKSYPSLTPQNPILTDINKSKPTTDYVREVPNNWATKLRGIGQTAANAMLLGGADEIAAFAKSTNAPGLPSEQFANTLSALEQQQRDFSAVNPELATGAEVGGVVASPVNLAGGELIAAGKGPLLRAGRAAGVGSTVGGTTGFLTAEGGLENRLPAAATGAGIGAGVGLGLQPGLELLGFGAKKGGETGLAVLNTVKNQMAARANPGAQADKLIARAFLDDLLKPKQMRQPLPGEGMINLGGENTTALGRQSTVAPGPARTTAANFFEEQAAGAPDRAADALKEMSDRGYYGTVQELDATRKASAKPLYDAAYARPAVEAWTPRIAELFKRPSMRAALAKAQRIAAEEGRNPKELGLDFNEAGDPMFLVGADKNGQIPSTQTMDYVKRGLDDVVEQYRDKTTGKLVLDTEGRAINNTRAEFLGILKEQNPEYKAALEAYAGPSHALDTLEIGRDIYNSRGKPADLIRRFQQLSPQDQDLARIGFVRNAIEDLGNVGDAGSVYLKLFGNQNKRAVAEVMFPSPEAFNKFAAQMQAEKKMLSTNRTVMGGSPTARIEAEKATYDQASNALSIIDALKSGNPLRIVGQALDKARNLQRGVTPEVADALANRLFTTDKEAIAKILTRLGVIPPAPTAALPGGMLRKTPVVPLVGQSIGIGAGQAYSPKY